MLLATTGCATAGARGAGQGGAGPAADDVRRYARVLAMADARAPDSALVDSALASRWPALRSAAVLAAGQTHARALRPRLRALLADPDTAVAASAAFALGLMRDTASVPTLAAALQRAPSVASEAAWSLGEIGEPARDAIVSALAAARERPSHAAPALLLAAAKLRPVPLNAVLPFAAPSASTPPDVIRAAAYALSRGRVPGGARALLGLAHSTDAETREYAARGLARGTAGDSLADTAVATLRALARDRSAHVRINALRALGSYGARAREPITAAVRDADANVRITAAQSLARVLGPEPAPWRELWAADTGFMYRRSLLAAAVASGAEMPALRGAPDEDPWGRAADWRYRASAAEAAASAPRLRVAREIAQPLTRDPDGRVRAAAYGALAPWVDSTGGEAWPRDSLLSALRDADFYVRSTALDALAGTARASEVLAVLASYEMARRDTANDARLSALKYLAAAWRTDSAAFSDSLRTAVTRLPRPADPLELAAGQGTTLLAGWRPDSAPRHPDAWYEAAVRSVVLPSLRGEMPVAEIVTERGTIELQLFGADAPLTVVNFLSLARAGFLRDTRFHRVVPNFVAQDGDPRGDGNGGPGYAIRDELNRRRYERGTVGMALSGPDTGGSQYFLTLSPQPHLDGHYTAFGRVARGLDVMDHLVQGDRIVEVRVP